MKPSQTIIYLEKDEEITSVVDRLVEVDEKDVILVIPENSLLGQSAVNLKLLRREAGVLEKSLTVVTKDESLKKISEKNGFPTYSSLDEAALLQPEIKSEAVPEQAKGLEGLTYEKGPAPEVEQVPVQAEGEKKQDDGLAPELESAPSPQRREGDILEELIAQTRADKKVIPPAEQKTPPVKPRMNDVVWPEPKQLKKSWKIPFLGKKETTAVPSASSVASTSAAPPASTTIDPAASLKKAKEPISPKKALIIFVAAALLLLGAVLFFVLPKAKIEIFTKKTPLAEQIEIIASKDLSNIDLSDKKIPAQIITVEKVQKSEFSSTGERQLNEKAGGIITVYNSYSSSPQTLIETTRFVSQDGKVFRTTQTITVPGAKVQEGKIIPNSIDVEVVADQPGSDYNIGPSDFTIPGFKGTAKYDAFYGKSKTDMSGGATGLKKVVLQEDLDKAKNSLQEQALKQAEDELYQQIPKELKLLDECLKAETVEIIPSHKSGDQTEKFSLEVRARAKAIIFDESDVRELAQRTLLTKVVDDQELRPETLEFSYVFIQSDFDKWIISLRVQVGALASEKIEVDQIREKIVGKDEVEVRRIFGQTPEVDSAKVVMWPFWVKKIPSHPSRVEIKVQ